MFVTFHEHIIRVSHGSAEGLTKAELWEALLEFVRKPQEFVEHMTHAEILEETKTEAGAKLTRKLHFDKVEVNDSVDIREKDSEIVTSVAASEHIPESTFLIKVEEPEEGNLFMRFIYSEDERNENPMYQDIRKQAYQAKDEHLVEELLKWIFNKKKN